MDERLQYLRVEISELLVTDFNYGDPLVEFQSELKRRFSKNYTIEEIEEEVQFLKCENEIHERGNGAVTEDKSDHYEGFN